MGTADRVRRHLHQLALARPERLSAAGGGGVYRGGFPPGRVMGSRDARGVPIADQEPPKSRGRWLCRPLADLPLTGRLVSDVNLPCLLPNAGDLFH